MEYYSVIKKNKILPFATAWMDLEGIRERQISYDFTYVWNMKNKINKHDRNKLIDTENKSMAAT